jgi:hypothetical protein
VRSSFLFDPVKYLFPPEEPSRTLAARGFLYRLACTFCLRTYKRAVGAANEETQMRELTEGELQAVSGGATNVSSQTTVVSSVNTSTRVKQLTVQRNGVTIKNFTKIWTS